jgi:membrane protease YdiL (CAAX protease family)
LSASPAETPGAGTAGPPDPGTVSFSERPAAGLYVAAWVLTGAGASTLLFAASAGSGILFVGGLALILTGLVAAAGYQLVARRQRPAGRFRGPSPPILFSIQFGTVYPVLFVLIALGLFLPTTPVGFLVSSIGLLAGYVAVVWLFGIRSGALRWRDLGLGGPYSASRVVADIAAGGATMFVAAVFAGVLGRLVAQLLDTTAPDVVPIPVTGLDIAAAALGAGILLPIGEELFFRGYALTAWLRDLGPRAALLRATLFFAAVHLLTITSPTFESGLRQAALVLAIIGPVGFALGWLYLRRGLVAAIAGHAAFNLFGILVLVLSQLVPPPGTG